MSIPRKLPKRAADTASRLFRRLVKAIVQGELQSGQPLREAALARSWKVSRTPLREAVRRVAENGLLVLRPNQAPLVRPLSIEDVQSLYELREELEVYALRCAWPRLDGQRAATMLARSREVSPDSPGWERRFWELDRQLHQLWIDQCGNTWLQTDLGRHLQFLAMFQRCLRQDKAALTKGHQEHFLIVESIQRRDMKGACAVLRRHIRYACRVVKRTMELESEATG